MKINVENVKKIDYGYGINVNCPFCERWQKVEELNDWYPGEGEFEGNQECESCGKVFSVTAEE